MHKITFTWRKKDIEFTKCEVSDPFHTCPFCGAMNRVWKGLDPNFDYMGGDTYMCSACRRVWHEVHHYGPVSEGDQYEEQKVLNLLRKADMGEQKTEQREIQIPEGMTGQQFEEATAWMRKGDSAILVLPSGNRLVAFCTNEGTQAQG